MKMKTLIAVAVAGAFAVPFAAQASADNDRMILAQAGGSAGGSAGTGGASGGAAAQGGSSASGTVGGAAGGSQGSGVGSQGNQAGGPGAGPCEFRQLWWAMPYRGDSIAVLDYASHTIAILSGDGACGREVRLPHLDVAQLPHQRKAFGGMSIAVEGRRGEQPRENRRYGCVSHLTSSCRSRKGTGTAVTG